jgi:hypothetical protein
MRSLRAHLKGGLTLRMVTVSGLLALIVGAVFVVLVVAIEDQRDSARLAVHSRAELAAADSLEKLVIDLETGVRGFVITREEGFLEPWGVLPGPPSQSRPGSWSPSPTTPSKHNGRAGSYAPLRLTSGTTPFRS